MKDLILNFLNSKEDSFKSDLRIFPLDDIQITLLDLEYFPEKEEKDVNFNLIYFDKMNNTNLILKIYQNSNIFELIKEK